VPARLAGRAPMCYGCGTASGDIVMRVKSNVAVALALLLLPVALSSAQAGDSVRVGLAAVYPAYSIPYAAKELGYYKEKDLDVEITQFKGGPATQQALASGAIDISTIVPGAAALAIAKGVQEKIVALSVPPTPQGWYIMVPASSLAKTMADLNGKTVGITQSGSLTDFWVLQAAAKAGVTVKTAPLGAAALMGALKSKQIDAAILWPAFSYKGLVDGDLRAVLDLNKTMEPVVSEGWAASNELIEKRPAVLHRWLEANAKTLIYMSDHADWSIKFLKTYFDEQDERVIKPIYENFIKNINPDGAMKLEWMTRGLELAASANLETKLTVDQVFSSAFTPIKVQ
jgi:ABC-type nitrate/sulfonate/bicarbonate transport system substrate-binding protein